MDSNMSFVLIIVDSDETVQTDVLQIHPITTRTLSPPFTSQRGISSEMKASDVLCVFDKLEMMIGLKAPPTLCSWKARQAHHIRLRQMASLLSGDEETEVNTKIQIANGSQ